jgi:hypothetical protein
MFRLVQVSYMLCGSHSSHQSATCHRLLCRQLVRSFRVAATLCAAQLVSSMVDVRKQLLDALAQVSEVAGVHGVLNRVW